MSDSHLLHVVLLLTLMASHCSLQGDDRFKPPIGNGYIATNVLSDTVYVNGLYSGYLEDSHRARIPAVLAIDVVAPCENPERKYSLEMFKGIFSQRVVCEDIEVNVDYFVHRRLTSIIVTNVHLSWRSGHARERRSNRTLVLNSNHGGPSQDLTEVNIEINYNNTIGHMTGRTRTAEAFGSQQLMTVHQYWTVVPSNLNLSPSEEHLSRTFISALGTDKNDVSDQFKRARNLSYEALLTSHTLLWRDLWSGGLVTVEGNEELQKNINSCLYHIFCSVPSVENPTNPFAGVSPGGLSRGGKVNPDKKGGPSNDYAGHVFWDMDTWIMPPILLFQPEMARRMITARTNVLDAARRHAFQTGYEGARFPWEQAATGEETCPWDLASKYQIHITADVSFALRQYLYMVEDDRAKDMLDDNRGCQLAVNIARFWKSRSSNSTNQTNTYEILGVMGPDEYHYNINNSVFTNYNAKLSLQLPAELQRNQQCNFRTAEIKEFQTIAENLKILFDKQLQYHPQFEGLNLSEPIKQSDVVLLGFPLMMPMPKEVRKNDLLTYEKVTDPYGPDTGTWSMHTVGWLELGEPHRALTNFQMMFRNINGPFKVFSEKPAESPDGVRCVNFITLGGGILQAVLFGYGGIRIHKDELIINPQMLPNATQWAINGLKYKGFTFDFVFHEHKLSITLKQTPTEKDIWLEAQGQSVGPMKSNSTADFLPGLVSIKALDQPHQQSSHNACGTSTLTNVLLIMSSLLLTNF